MEEMQGVLSWESGRVQWQRECSGRGSAMAEGVPWQRVRPGLAGRAGEQLQDGILSPLATSKDCELATRGVSLELPQAVMPAGDQDFKTSNSQGIPRSRYLSWSRASRASRPAGQLHGPGSGLQPGRSTGLLLPGSSN